MRKTCIKKKTENYPEVRGISLWIRYVQKKIKIITILYVGGRGREGIVSYWNKSLAIVNEYIKQLKNNNNTACRNGIEKLNLRRIRLFVISLESSNNEKYNELNRKRYKWNTLFNENLDR